MYKISLFRLGTLLLLLAGLSACGQKGDLYLPPEEIGFISSGVVDSV